MIDIDSISSSSSLNNSYCHLLGIEDLSVDVITYLLNQAKDYHSYELKNKDFSVWHEPLSDLSPSPLPSLSPHKPIKSLLAGLIIVNLFFESSTRTRASFELAAKKLGASVLNITPATTSMKKGETLLDMAATLAAMQPNILIMRHPEAGSTHLLADKISTSVINAGDGCHEHPTQALVDVLSMYLKLGRIKGLNIAICGDIRHSRVARSNLLLLKKMGAYARLIAPRTLLPTHDLAYDVPIFTDMRQGLKDCDVIMMLRLQTERMKGRFVPTAREYFHFFGLDQDKLTYARPDAIIMHPGPMNRGVEIDGIVADDIDRSIITTQVALGVAVRMACLTYLAQQSSMIANKSALYQERPHPMGTC